METTLKARVLAWNGQKVATPSRMEVCNRMLHSTSKPSVKSMLPPTSPSTRCVGWSKRIEGNQSTQSSGCFCVEKGANTTTMGPSALYVTIPTLPLLFKWSSACSFRTFPSLTHIEEATNYISTAARTQNGEKDSYTWKSAWVAAEEEPGGDSGPQTSMGRSGRVPTSRGHL